MVPLEDQADGVQRSSSQVPILVAAMLVRGSQAELAVYQAFHPCKV